MIGKTLGHFQITEKLGESGMGEASLAEPRHISRQVAFKILPEGFAHDAERFGRSEPETILWLRKELQRR